MMSACQRNRARVSANSTCSEIQPHFLLVSRFNTEASIQDLYNAQEKSYHASLERQVIPLRHGEKVPEKRAHPVEM